MYNGVTDKDGYFVIDKVLPGPYKALPLQKSERSQLKIEPPEIKFQVKDRSMTLQTLEIVGYPVIGKVVNG